MPTSWLRLYNTTLSDRRLKLISIETKLPRPFILGVWVSLLILANESPDKGQLLAAKGVPLPLPFIAGEIGIDRKIFSKVLVALEECDLVTVIEDDTDYWIITIKDWHKYQPDSDNNYARVMRYRQRRADNNLPKIPQYNRTYIIERDNSECVYCGDTKDLCIDHVHPIIYGGTDDYKNLVCACKACNSGKQGRTPAEAGMFFLNSEAEERYKNYLEESNFQKP